MRDLRRKIVKPPAPAREAAELNRPDSNNGSRDHYPAMINAIIVGDQPQPLAEQLEIHYKQFKAEKNKDPKIPENLAKLEVAFSELYYYMLGKHMSAKPYLAVDPQNQNKIVGLATDQLNFETLDRSPDFWDAVDKRLLGRVLMMFPITGEDDGHKHNIGPEKLTADQIANNQRPRPIKIDNDMNWYDQIFSRMGVGKRYALHPFSQNRHEFNSADIDNFPNTTTFRPHHWMAAPNKDLDFKGYGWADKNAMIALSNDPEFKNGAYFQLLTFILLPKELLRTMLLQHLEESDFLFPLVLNTWIEQQANLKAAALGSANFRQSILANRATNQQEFTEVFQAYQQDINRLAPNAVANIDVDGLFNNMMAATQQSQDAQDSALHAAIRSQKFRFDESMQRYGNQLSTPNGDGVTPLTLAINLGIAAAEANPAEWDKVEYFKHAAQYLVDQSKSKVLPNRYLELLQHKKPLNEINALPTSYEKFKGKLAHGQSIAADIASLSLPQYKSILTAALADRQHSKVAIELINAYASVQPEAAEKPTLQRCLLDTLKDTLKSLRDDPNMTLKMKKNAAILAFKAVTPHLQTGDNFNELRQILDDSENKFIKQLTSRLEWIRHLRGLYGVTSTYKTIADDIKNCMNKRKSNLGNLDAITRADVKHAIEGVQRKFSTEMCTFFARHTYRTKVESFEKRLEREPQLVAAPGA